MWESVCKYRRWENTKLYLYDSRAANIQASGKKSETLEDIECNKNSKGPSSLNSVKGNCKIDFLSFFTLICLKHSDFCLCCVVFPFPVLFSELNSLPVSTDHSVLISFTCCSVFKRHPPVPYVNYLWIVDFLFLLSIGFSSALFRHHPDQIWHGLISIGFYGNRLHPGNRPAEWTREKHLLLLMVWKHQK